MKLSITMPACSWSLKFALVGTSTREIPTRSSRRAELFAPCYLLLLTCTASKSHIESKTYYFDIVRPKNRFAVHEIVSDETFVA